MKTYVLIKIIICNKYFILFLNLENISGQILLNSKDTDLKHELFECRFRLLSEY